MKKILSVAFLLMLSVALHAQKEVTKFLGIPVDGSKSSMIQKLKNKGFVYDPSADYLKGEFNGQRVNVYVVTNNNRVCRIMVCDKTTCDEGQIKIRYNTLCRQFANNQKYVPISAEELSDSEDISYEMTVNKKEYQAGYAQLPADDDLRNRFVWFTISEFNGDYYITMFYDNEFNRAHGEDL
ncbi:hypothetical protein [Prevotella jejuni]|uniref:hypothetical protein n=1 Tax=Prevotella jejuni TaxID=1177574 RepID=UPI001BAB25D1|nr:hypothetical protein [Prevotella jejuni]QUB81886.1 hypothetical protein J5A63_13090 [Prevotella jejuni]